MCRLAAYLGPEIFISSLVTEPKHSIIHQSFKAQEIEEPLNGDGFGLAWYARDYSEKPALFKEVTPAWNNRNLFNLSRLTRSSCILTHVRAATVGKVVSRANCHPFSWEEYSFAHNGTIEGFEAIRRKVQNSLSDECFDLINGHTDSEHAFALLVESIKLKTGKGINPMAEALLDTIQNIEKLREQHKIADPSSLNFMFTDGTNIVASRYASPGTPNKTLYYCVGNRYISDSSGCYMEPTDHHPRAALLASEPLSDPENWISVPENHLILIDASMNVKFQKIGEG